MKDFYRALRDARQYWRTLLIAIVLSAGVAALWSANIAAIFPIIQVTLEGKSLSDWNRERRDTALKEIAKRQEQIETLRVESAAPETPEPRRRTIAGVVGAQEARIAVERRVADSAQAVQPWFDRWFPAKPFETVLLLAVALVVSTLLKHVLMIASTMLVHYVSNRVARSIRLKLFDKALALDRGQFMAHGAGGFMAHIQHTTEMLAQGITTVYGMGVSEPLKLMACLIGAFYISWQLTLASLTTAPLVAFAIVWLNRKFRETAKRILARSAAMHHVLLESFNSMLTVQANCMENFERNRFGESTRTMLRTSMWAAFYNSLSGPAAEALGIGMLCTAIVAGSYLAITRETHIWGVPMSDQPLEIPRMMVFFGMLVGCSDPLRKLSGVIQGVNSGVVAANSLYALLDKPSRIVESSQPRTAPRPFSAIRFRDVTFGYGAGAPTLKHVDLTFRFGERVAIVGPNGSGKSTLVNLLCRFYDPQSGDVALDDVSVRDMKLSDLRGRIAFVSQQTELFNESILFNIRYGRPEATLEEAVAAAEKAHAHEFIAKLPEGYNTVVGPNGHRLSGGQRQRIALARAILRNSEILVLDEATSQIDVESERLIHDTLLGFGRDRTLLMITHRASTLALADTIVTVEHGTASAAPNSPSPAANGARAA